ncbi:MAG: FAD-dependent oxidoreductase, partial [Myxococcota bacterium]
GKIATRRFRGLDPVTVVQGLAEAVDVDARRVTYRSPDGSEATLDYDALVIATGFDNGFWRRTRLEGSADEASRRAAERARVEGAERIAIVGGGGSGVSLAASLAERYPDKRLRLFHGGERLLPAHHARVGRRAREHLEGLGVEVRFGHRAVVPEGAAERLGAGPIAWTTGQPAEPADLVLWALGQARPNSGFLPSSVLDARGFVPVRPTLQLPDDDHVFCVGDLAATDRLRSSARNGGTAVVVANVRRVLRGRRARRTYRAPKHRWGELFTSPRDGMWLFTPGGRRVRLAQWFLRPVILDFVLFRLIYGGVRRASGEGEPRGEGETASVR